MSELTKHYSLLLGLDAAWEVSEVSLSLEGKCVEILVKHQGGAVTCPQCEGECSIADHAPERTWRHLDTMQFETRLRTRVPRANCKACGVKTTAVPWAGKHSRFTLMFEAVAVDMWPAYANSIETNAEQAEIVHDRFHISKHLNEAVDQVRRQEHKALKQSGDDRLTGSKQLWLFNPENMSEGFNSRIQSIKSQARGFRAFKNYRTRILFYCGKLDLKPPQITH